MLTWITPQSGLMDCSSASVSPRPGYLQQFNSEHKKSVWLAGCKYTGWFLIRMMNVNRPQLLTGDHSVDTFLFTTSSLFKHDGSSLWRSSFSVTLGSVINTNNHKTDLLKNHQLFTHSRPTTLGVFQVLSCTHQCLIYLHFHYMTLSGKHKV